MTVSVKLDKDGHSYFNADLWRKMSKCYELKAGNKILVRAPQPGLINMDVYFPNVISRSKSDEVSVLSTFSMLSYYLAKSGYLF